MNVFGSRAASKLTTWPGLDGPDTSQSSNFARTLVSVRPVPVDSWRVCHEVPTLIFLVGTLLSGS